MQKRNANYRNIVRNLNFDKDSEQNSSGASQARAALQDIHSESSNSALPLIDLDEPEGTVLSQGYQRAEFVVWVGDFNYRIDLPYANTLEEIGAALNSGGSYKELLKHDQCRVEMLKGVVFHGLREAQIDFQPTYKFNKNASDRLAYDSSEKQRVPAWTDRIFFRGSKPFQGLSDEKEESASHNNTQSGRNDGFHQPGDASGVQNPVELQEPDEISVQSHTYDACVDVIDSDHKPVWAVLTVDFPSHIQRRKRAQCLRILQKVAGPEKRVPVTLSSDCFDMANGDTQTLEVKNEGDCMAALTIVSDRSCLKFIPLWLEIVPITMFVPPKQRGLFYLTAYRSEQGPLQSRQALSAKLLVRVEAVSGGWVSSPKHYGITVQLKPKRDRSRSQSLTL